MLDEEILKLARLEIALDAEPQNYDAMEELWKRSVAACTLLDFALIRIAKKILVGRKYLIATDNADHLARYRAFAERLGAKVVDHCRHPLFDFDHDLDQILILPQSHH
jgi:hypothetical protein